MKYNIKYIICCLVVIALIGFETASASSHREAPLIANDPLADNTDLYAFRSPDDPNTITIIANYIPGQLPHGGPNYYSFGENIRYQIHIDNNTETPGDDIIYRATFDKVNNDPTTFFNIRLGAENLQTTYTLERSMDGGASFESIVMDGVVPPNNIGPRSIQGGAGLGANNYKEVMENAIATASTGETVFCGPIEDPFFVDLAGVFDLGDLPRQGAMSRDGLECYNVHTITLKIPIETLQKEGKSVDEATTILDGDYVIGVWASASRPAMRTLQKDMGTQSFSGDWVQVSRLGMPLTNEAVIPIGDKDEWNARTPYNENPEHFEHFFNPELGLYMDDDQFGAAVPAFTPLRIQTKSLAGLLGPDFPGFDFSNGADGLYSLKGNAALDGTALDDAVFGTLLLPDAGKPRSVDLWPAFHTGVPNVPPYQLATGKMGNPLNAGKPFVNNFLPNGGDMLRLNMAVPPTPRNSKDFSALGLIQAAVLGLTDPMYASTTDIQFIPNMDGFPNGRRLEDDVTRIELQAVAGAVLAAVGLWYDDYDVTDSNASPVTQDLLDVITYSTGVDKNDQDFQTSFPYVAAPYSGTGPCSGAIYKAAPAATPPPVACNISIWHEVDCNEDNTSFNVFINLINGTPPFVFMGDLTGVFEDQMEYEVGPFADGDSYQISVTDANGCEASIEATPIPCSKLPVTLISFSGEITQEGNLLNWLTASEINSNRFIIERSTDGLHFQVIGSQTSAGTSNTIQTYEFLDKKPPAGRVYYRLLEVSTSDEIQVHGVVQLTREYKESIGIIKLFPVPIKEVLNLDYTVPQTGTVSLRVLDIRGREVWRQQLTVNAGVNTQQLKLGELPAGTYFLDIRQADQFMTTKFVKR